MKKLLVSLFAFAFGRHCTHSHNADYEVCHQPLCWLAYKVEQLTDFQTRMRDGAW